MFNRRLAGPGGGAFGILASQTTGWPMPVVSASTAETWDGNLGNAARFLR